MSGKATGTVKLPKMHNVYWLRQQVQFLRVMTLILIIYRVLVQGVCIVCARFLDLVQILSDGVMK